MSAGAVDAVIVDPCNSVMLVSRASCTHVFSANLTTRASLAQTWHELFIGPAFPHSNGRWADVGAQPPSGQRRMSMSMSLSTSDHPDRLAAILNRLATPILKDATCVAQFVNVCLCNARGIFEVGMALLDCSEKARLPSEWLLPLSNERQDRASTTCKNFNEVLYRSCY